MWKFHDYIFIKVKIIKGKKKEFQCGKENEEKCKVE